MKKIITALILAVAYAMPAAAATWTLDNDASKVAYISIKAMHTGEVNTFQTVSGSLSQGQADVAIDLASVDTGIDIRDERMREKFFQVADYPDARLTAEFEASLVEGLAPGSMTRASVPATLSLHGRTQELELAVRLIRMDDATLVATSEAPVIIDAEEFGLSEGVNTLREIAGLDAISRAVPVTFNLVFRK